MKSFLQGKKSLSVPPLRLPTPSGGTSLPRPGMGPRLAAITTDACAGAGVDVIKEGDKVTRLVVTCTCGEKIEINCIYPVGS